MKILLDTHIFLWWITDSPLLSQNAREVIANGNNALYWSAVSTWEVAIKHALGRLPLPESPEELLPIEFSRNHVEPLPVIDEHAFRAGRLPPHHRDPFDRMLVAQAQFESLVLLTNDRKLEQYDVELCW